MDIGESGPTGYSYWMTLRLIILHREKIDGHKARLDPVIYK